ncbi:MAG: TIGR03619 family F420-dependent LLM class oxidoreductase [Acidimicrobiales bacterium]
MAMTYGIHLPQYGQVAGGPAVARAAQHAEELGFSDVWVSDHIVHPAEQSYPSPYLLDPFATLTWAAAVTERVRLGTSVIVVPQHNPVWLANHLASVDLMSGGRLIVGAGVGWSKREYEALGQSFGDRGKRLDEILDLLRAAWRDDPTSFDGDTYAFTDIRFLPKPAHEIPIWIGGGVEAAFRRAVEKGDGFHAVGLTPSAVAPIVERLRRDRPEEGFTISARTGWDPQGMDPGLIREEDAAFEAAGVQHVVAAPWQKDLASWLRSMDLLAEIVGPG